MLFGHFTGKVVIWDFLSGQCGGSYFLKKTSDYFMFLLESATWQSTQERKCTQNQEGAFSLSELCVIFLKGPLFLTESCYIAQGAPELIILLPQHP